MTKNNSDKIPHYTESIFYELKQMARILKFHADQVFEELNFEISPGEYCTLDIIMCNPSLCQRDLSKLLLLDRANTGRILNNLEAKGLIVRTVDTKNNRLIKKVDITKDGSDELNRINHLIIDKYHKITEKIPQKEFDSVRLSIRKLRENMEKQIENKI
ncbi:MarR family transcriptional regulator [bacterium]|nr:MarR family transcriptional regulator [bacterium]